MSLINGLRWCQVCTIVACTWVLSSCGGSGDWADPAYAYVANAGTLSTYSINPSTGGAVAGSPFSAGTDPSAVSIDPTDRFVYVVNDGSANVSEFALESTGGLTPLAGSPVPVENDPGSMAIVWQ